MAKFPTWIPVVAGALDDGHGRYLMQRRPSHKHHGGLWEFPGGKVEPGENPRIALVRELNEELTIHVDSLSLFPLAFSESSPSPTDPGVVILLYKIVAWDGSPEPQDGARIDWFLPESIRTLPVPPVDSQLIEAIFEREQ